MAKVLIIDDSEGVRKKLNLVLTEIGLEVIQAEDGLDGLAQFQKNQDVSLMICDVNMPRLDGLGMLEQLNLKYSELPSIFMLTTETTREAKLRGKRAGVRAWVTKPYNPTVLANGVKKVLGLN
jgi:two-component system chemotaxis response regulator CheY